MKKYPTVAYVPALGINDSLAKSLKKWHRHLACDSNPLIIKDPKNGTTCSNTFCTFVNFGEPAYLNRLIVCGRTTSSQYFALVNAKEQEFFPLP